MPGVVGEGARRLVRFQLLSLVIWRSNQQRAGLSCKSNSTRTANEKGKSHGRPNLTRMHPAARPASHGDLSPFCMYACARRGTEWGALFVHMYIDSMVWKVPRAGHSIIRSFTLDSITCYILILLRGLWYLPITGALLKSSLLLWPPVPNILSLPAYLRSPNSRAGLRSEPFPRPNHPLVQGGSSRLYLDPGTRSLTVDFCRWCLGAATTTTASLGHPTTPSMTGRKTR